jgi:branched-chain amino acid transport system substrate-binding protein
MLLKVLLVGMLTAIIFCRWGCTRKPIRIGFVGGLSGSMSDLGVAGRDGALLAVEEINQRGGINGRPLELLVRDDRNDAVEAVRVDRELVSAGVVAIVGHMTSAMSLAGVPVANEAKVLMLSPTTSSNELTGVDDWFVRLYPPSQAMAGELARHARNALKVRRMVVIYDTDNRGHAESWLRAFRQEFAAQGGEIVAVKSFSSRSAKDFTSLVERSLAPAPDSLFVIADALDTAMLCQQLAKRRSILPIIVTEWSTTDQLLQGGRAVERVSFVQNFDRQLTSPAYLSFRDAYSRRFNLEPNFAALFSYESVMLLAQALATADTPAEIRQTILAIGSFQGLQGKITLDRFGEARRTPFVTTIRQGRFVRWSDQ